jgi:hypothetical protein
MAGSARFGGQIDASGILSDIYESDLRNREALAGAAAGRAREEQNALDRDAQSRWQSGEMSDGDWLAYVRGRVAASAGFPEEKAEWEKVLRESSDMIAVNQAEFAFQQGGSINQLIAFYEVRAKGQGGNSVAGRETQDRLNQLRDQRLSDEITRNVEDLQDRIDAGQAKPADLLAYLQGARRQARNNSDLARSLDGDIEQMDDQIAAFQRDYALQSLQHQWSTGAISGDEYAAGLRAAAAPFQNTDPSTYFGLLAEAAVGDRYGQYAFNGETAGSGGGRSGTAGGGRRNAGPLSINGLSAEWDDRRWRGADILQQVMAGKTEVTDPGTGEVIDVTTTAGKRWLENVNRDVFSTFAAQRRVGTEIGDQRMVTAASEGHDAFLLDYTQPSNTMLARESAGFLIQSVSNALSDGGPLDRNMDPVASQRELIRLADKIDRYVNANTAGRPDTPATRDEAPGDTSITTGPESQVDPGFLGELSMLSGALRTGQFDENLNVSSGIGDLLNDADMEAFASRSATIHDKATGLGTRYTYAVLPGEGVAIVPMVTAPSQQIDPNTGAAVMTMRAVPDPRILAEYGIDENYTPVAVAVQVGDEVIRMNGYSSYQPSPWKVWGATQDITLADGRVLPKGAAINRDVYNAMSPAERESLADSGQIIQTEFMVETFQAPDSDGRLVTYTKVPGGSWAMGTYPMRPQVMEDGTVSLDADNNLSGTARPVDTVPVPFIGTDPKLAQQAVDSGMFDDVIAQTRGVNWETYDALPTPYDPTGAFWNEQDEAARLKNSRRTELARDGYGSEGQKTRAWWNQRGRERRGRDAWSATKRANREAAKSAAEDREATANRRGAGMLDDLFSTEGAGVGVTFGTRSPGGNREATPRSPSSFPTPQMPSTRLPRIGQQNIDFIPPSLPAPQASSGPFISRTGERPTPSPQPSTSLPSSFLTSVLNMGKSVAGIGSKPPAPKPPSTSSRGGITPT